MSDIGSLSTFTTGANTVADLNSNFSAIKTAFNTYAVQTDKAITITVQHTFTAGALLRNSGAGTYSGLLLDSAYTSNAGTNAYGNVLTYKSTTSAGVPVGVLAVGHVTHTSGTVTQAFGVEGYIIAGGNGGFTTIAAPVKSFGETVSGAIITSWTCFNASAPAVGAGTVTTLYGLYLNPMTMGGTNYGVYTNAGVNSFGDSVLSRSPTGGMGYATGAGGAITQGTSRTTGVTLNTVCGTITLFSAAGSATPASFTVTNSTVAATDTIRVVQKSGTDKYILLVTAVAAGSFEITFYTTGGTTTEQPVFNFSVHKGVAA